ncbi:MAG: ABC transporter substrate-binding protein [Desulfovibrio sp.]|nr:ABC transporter substrate-binding protein [Desulfovibrio sp.]
MKKWTTLLVLLVLVSCSGSGGDRDEPEAENADGLIVVGFSQVGAESDWRRANTRSMRETFTKEKGYKLILKDAQQKQEAQIAALREFIRKKVHYIVLAPVTEQGWDPVLQEAKSAGIPVIIMDRMIRTADPSLFSSWVGSDFRKEGGTAVDWMEKTFREKDVLRIAHMTGNLGSSAQIGRTEGLQEGVDRNVGWKILVRDSGDFTQVKGKEVMERFLSEYREIDVLYCENDDMALGAIQALREAHLPFGSAGGLKIVSFDATRAGLEQTLAGNIAFNVECNPLHGPRVENIIRQLRAGRTPSKIAYVEEAAFSAAGITREEVDARAY